jgi:hypothetical protein
MQPGGDVAENPEDNPWSDESVVRALEAVRSKVSKAERDRAELERVIIAAREEQRLLERLLALRRGDGASNPLSGPVPDGHVEESRGRNHDGQHPSVQVVIEELESANRPLHISDLMRILRERKIKIPGSGTQANLITHLRRDNRLVRPSRGMYGLAAWGLQSMPASPRGRRRRQRFRVTTSHDERPQT